MKFYLYVSMISCVLDFIRSYRTSKYRKHVDQKHEIVTATINIFLPIYHLFALIVNLYLIFQSEEYYKLVAMIEDMKVLSEEKEDLNE